MKEPRPSRNALGTKGLTCAASKLERGEEEGTEVLLHLFSSKINESNWRMNCAILAQYAYYEPGTGTEP